MRYSCSKTSPKSSVRAQHIWVATFIKHHRAIIFLSGDSESNPEDVWVIFCNDEGQLTFGNIGKVTDWIRSWKPWRGHGKSKRPYLDGSAWF